MPETVPYATPADALPPADPIPLRRRLAAEFVGTFLLVFFGCGSMAVDAAYGGAVGHVGIGIVWGVVVLAMIYAVGDVSGAHLNPAVSFAFWLSGRFPAKDAIRFCFVQIIAAVIAAQFLLLMFVSYYGMSGTRDVGQTNPSTPFEVNYSRPSVPVGAMEAAFSETSVFEWEDSDLTASVFITESRIFAIVRAFAFEVVLTFALVFVILCVAVGSKERGLMAGIAIGGTVGICALAAGPVCRASMNPARSIGPAIAALDFQHLWLYCTAPFLGAAAAVGAWTYIYRHPKPGSEVHEVTVPEATG